MVSGRADVWAQLVGVWENEFSDAAAEDALYALTAVTDPYIVNVIPQALHGMREHFCAA